jgi:hypothetical protein
VRRGGTIRVRLLLRRPGGELVRRTVRVPVPRSARSGHRDLVLRGTPADAPPTGADDSGLELFFGPLTGGDGGVDPPATVAGLAAQIAGLQRFDGVRAAFLRPDAAPSSRNGAGRAVAVAGDLRVSGSARLPLIVR